MSKGSSGHPVKAVQLSLQFPRNAAGTSDLTLAAKSHLAYSFSSTTDASSPTPIQSSRFKSRSSNQQLLSPEQLLPSPSDSARSATRGWAATWDAQASSLPLGIALLLQQPPNTSEDRISPRVALDPLPFSKSRARHFVTERMSNVITGSQSPGPVHMKDLKCRNVPEPLLHSVSAPTNRSEAMLLADTFRLLREQLQRDVGDTFQAAELHANLGKIDGVWKLLNEELGIAVSTFAELCRQVRCECSDRGDLLEQVGLVFQRIIGVLYNCNHACAKENQGSSKHMAEAANREHKLQQEIDHLKDELAEKEKQLLSFHSKIMHSGVSLAVSESHTRSLKESFESTRRLSQTSAIEHKNLPLYSVSAQSPATCICLTCFRKFCSHNSFLH
jgi:hypothetical protein